jgi:hypothetical protein
MCIYVLAEAVSLKSDARAGTIPPHHNRAPEEFKVSIAKFC